MNRRRFVAPLILLLMVAMTLSSFAQGRRARLVPRRTLPKYTNSQFYKADGSFNEEFARKAFEELFRYHDYSLAKPILAGDPKASLCGDKLWILDFNIGDFANVGMGGIFFVNDKENGYFGHEIYLLPYQMIPQHQHMDAEGKAPKHEAWQVRHGSVWCFSEGGAESDLANYPPEIAKALKSHIDAKVLACYKGTELNVGEMTSLAGQKQKHFMIAGPEGAVVTEYASFHAQSGLVINYPNAKVGNTEAKKTEEPKAETKSESAKEKKQEKKEEKKK